MKPES